MPQCSVAELEPAALRDRVQVSAYDVDCVSQLKSVEPAIWDRGNSENGTKDLAGDASCAVAIATVIHCQGHPGFEGLGHQGAVQADGECLLCHPALPERLHTLRGRISFQR